MLRIQSIDVHYGKVQILFELSLSIEKGEIVSLIGSNGTGKTTTMRTVSGILVPRKGKIEFLGQRIEGKDPHDIASRGLIQIPEGRELFPTLSVMENLELGAITKEVKERKSQSYRFIFSMFPVLEKRAKQIAQTLSGGEQQMVAIGRGLMANPKLLMLDEPSMGLSPLLVKDIFKKVNEISLKEGLTIFLVEQNVAQSLAISKRAYVLETGHVVLQGMGKELINNDHVRKTYLGV